MQFITVSEQNSQIYKEIKDIMLWGIFYILISFLLWRKLALIYFELRWINTELKFQAKDLSLKMFKK